MTIAYICHPLDGNIALNLLAIRDIVREINLKEPHTVPFCPFYSDARAMDDDIVSERRRSARNTEFLLKKGFIDELRIYGPFLSARMADEITIANQMKIPIINKSEQIKGF